AGLMSVLALASRIVGLLRDRLLASEFGASESLDVYLAAFRIPDFIFNILVLGALSAAFVPIFTKFISHQQNQEAWRFTNTILNSMVIALIIIGVPLFLFAKHIMSLVAPGLSSEARELAGSLTQIMLLSPIFFGISNIAGSVLQSYKKFFLYSLAPILYNLGIIFGILFLVPRFGVYGLAWGVVLGAFIHMLVQLPSMFKFGWRYQPQVNMEQPGVIALFRLMGPRTFSLIIGQLNLIIITAIASFLSSGSISIFNFANNLQSVPVGVIGISFAVAAFPFLAESSAKDNNLEYIAHFAKTFRQILFFIIPLSVMMFLLRAQIVRLTLGSGEFDWEATVLTLDTLAFFCIGLLAQCLAPLLVRSFHTLSDTKTPLFVALISLAANLLIAYPLARIFGVAGLAFAFSLASILQALILFILLRLRLGDLKDRDLLACLFRVSISTMISALVCYGLLYVLASVLNTRTVIGLLLQTAGAFLGAALVYFAYHRWLKTDEFTELTNRNLAK
ncbi:MAG: integral membrane protein MviN, partial [uncultured bacterium]